MGDYQFLQYETHDGGAIVRILLDRPEARNAQNRGADLYYSDSVVLTGITKDNISADVYERTRWDVLLKRFFPFKKLNNQINTIIVKRTVTPILTS